MKQRIYCITISHEKEINQLVTYIAESGNPTERIQFLRTWQLALLLTKETTSLNSAKKREESYQKFENERLDLKPVKLLQDSEITTWKEKLKDSKNSTCKKRNYQN